MPTFNIIPNTDHHTRLRMFQPDASPSVWAYILTGIAKGEVEGYPDSWCENSVGINVPIPGYYGTDERFKLESWAPMITFSGSERPVDWKIDSIEVYRPEDPLTNVAIFCKLHIRGEDTIAYLAYSVSISGYR